MAARYSKKEDATILMYVNKYPTNLQFAFEKASKKLLYRSTEAICFRYYRSLRNQVETHLTCGSRRGFSRNVKNSQRRVTNSTPTQRLFSLKDLFSHFRGLF